MGEGTRWRRLAWGRSDKALLSENYRQTTSGVVVVDPRLLTIAVYRKVTIPGVEYQALRLPSGRTYSTSTEGTFRRDMITGKIDYLTKYFTLYDGEYQEDEYGHMVFVPDYNKVYGCTLVRDSRNSPWQMLGASDVALVIEQGDPHVEEVAFDDEDFPAGVDVPTAIAG